MTVDSEGNREGGSGDLRNRSRFQEGRATHTPAPRTAAETVSEESVTVAVVLWRTWPRQSPEEQWRRGKLKTFPRRRRRWLAWGGKRKRMWVTGRGKRLGGEVRRLKNVDEVWIAEWDGTWGWRD